MQSGIFEAPWDEARQVVHANAPAIDNETIAIAECGGYILAQNITALGDLPPFPASRIDGWAVAGKGPWQVTGNIMAGQESEVSLVDGQCIHIATGAALPIGATACLKDEESLVDENLVSAHLGAIELLQDGVLPIGHDVRPAGYEAKKDELVIPIGSYISPGIQGLIAACGYDQIEVRRKIKIDLIIFGDELLQSGPSREGKVRDSLGPQLSSWANLLGAQIINVKHVADTLADHVLAINESTADLIVTTGGTAAGPVDHLHQAIIECGGQLIIDAVLVRPGYHQLFAKLPSKFLLGLPGNPQSAIIGLLSLGTAFILGSNNIELPEFAKYSAGTDLKAPAREMKMTLSTLQDRQIFPVEYVDSSMLRGFVEADGYALIPPGGVKSGELVRWLNLPKALGL